MSYFIDLRAYFDIFSGMFACIFGGFKNVNILTLVITIYRLIANHRNLYLF